MNKQLKKTLSLLLALVLLSASLAAGFSAYGVENIIINETNFPDENFRKYVQTLDTDGNGSLSAQERNISFMSLTGYSVANNGAKMQNLTGIEYFASSLTTLRCANLDLESLDVSALNNLTSLSCMSNKLTSLDVSNNTKLTFLDCTDNQIETIKLGTNPNLQTLYCSINKLTLLHLTAVQGLLDFKCDQNELTTLNVSNNVLLQNFDCRGNHLSSLNLSKNTALVDVSSSSISDQTVSAEAFFSDSQIFVPFTVDNPSNIISSSLDKEGSPAYNTDRFYADDLSSIANGITYHYSVGNANIEDMEVKVDVTRNFCQVNYYTDSDMTTLIATKYANKNTAAPQPDIPSAPQCKAFASWSGDVTNVTEDMNVYPTYKDAHSYALTNFENDIATITCKVCSNSYTVAFKDCINAKSTDSNYCPYLDVVQDGVINAKDYSKLLKDWKKPVDDNDVPWGS